MFKKLIQLIVLTTSVTAVMAGNNTTIKGKVTEKETGKALSFATVVIQTEDDKVISGATSLEDGSFRISGAEITGENKIKVSYIGFKDTTIVFTLKDQNSTIDLGTIALKGEATSLTTAVVTARLPVIEQKLDKIIMNVAEAVSTQGSNALDILKKAPGVSVDPSGNILLNGSAVQVWIDGRPSNFTGADLEALLSGTDGSTIDKIEIIAHPSSRYDAAGSGGIINIRTKKNFIKGVNGSARMAYSGSPYEKYYQSIDGSLMINYRSEKNNLSLTYSPRFNETFNRFETTTELESGRLTEGLTHFDRANKGRNFKVANDYSVNKKSILGFVVSGMARGTIDTTQGPAISRIYDNGVLEENSITDIKSDFSFNNLSANLNFTKIFNEGTEITLNADYYYYDLGRYSNQINRYFDKENHEIKTPFQFTIDSKQYINIKSLKADYEQPFNDNGKIEAGIKWALSTTDNNLLREEKDGDVWHPDTEQSTIFYYTESISAAYATIAKKIGTKLNIKGGIRAELTQAEGDWITADTTTKKSYLDIFPTLFFGYNPNEKIRFGLSYTRRIQRPNFDQLNPQRFYIDVNTSALGNPDIKPQYGHHISATIGISRHFNLNIFGQFFDNVITQSPSIDQQTGEKLMTWDNFGKLSMRGINASLTEYSVYKWLTINIYGSVSNVNTSGKDYSASRIFTSANFNAAFNLPNDLKIELNGWGQSGIPYGFFTIEPNYEFTLGIRKGLMKNKGNITLLLSDILGTNINRVTMQDGIFKNYLFESMHRSKRATLIFSYRFGQSRVFKQRKVGTVDETTRVNSGA